WVTRRIWNESKPEALRTLQQYSHNKWIMEVMDSLIEELNAMNVPNKNNALMAIYELKQKPTVVRTTGSNQTDIKCIISMTDTLQSFEVKALLDSGCTG
ncbi:hypothetical protein AMATHDRAFT_103170, partial [Amanita thiersii Skay4041]